MQTDDGAISRPRQADYIERTFGKGGYLSKAKPGYVPRQGQIDFARAVDNALRQGVPLLAQAPCGTGKSIGYLVPAIAHAVSKKKCVIIATATNSLLDQLSKGPDCELAMLRRALPVPFKYATLKGRANYLCYRKYLGFDADMQNEQLKASARRLILWAEHTKTGDRGEAPETDARTFWGKISCNSEDCSKPACLHSKRAEEVRGGAEYCYSELAKDKAKEAQIIVTNIHYLITHLRFGAALPEFDHIIIDEGHELAEITRDFWGGEERVKSFDEIISYAFMMERSKMVPKGTGQTIQKEVTALFEYLNKLTLDPIKIALKKPQDFQRKKLLMEIAFDLTPLKEAMKVCAKVAKLSLPQDDEEKSVKAVKENLGMIEDDAQQFKNHFLKLWDMIKSLESKDSDIARWVEVNNFHGTEDTCIKYAPIEVGHILRENLFKVFPGTVLASATLATGGNFSFIRREVGLDREIKIPESKEEARIVHGSEIDIPSPFHHQDQCLFLIPKEAKDPSGQNYELWIQCVFKTLRRVIELCDGRTLGLFTSRKAMEQAASWIRELMPKRTILVQGEYAPREIAQRFRSEKESVLLGTRSFWTGLDIPGESLTALVIDKLPIPQDEPILQAMKEKMGGSYFDRYLFPKASITLQQGCGRVIRSGSDVGVIVLCDPRIQTKRYGHHFSRSLPTMDFCDDIEKIPEFLISARYSVDAKNLSK